MFLEVVVCVMEPGLFPDMVAIGLTGLILLVPYSVTMANVFLNSVS